MGGVIGEEGDVDAEGCFVGIAGGDDAIEVWWYGHVHAASYPLMRVVHFGGDWRLLECDECIVDVHAEDLEGECASF